MYNYISQIINHVWQTGSGAPGDQQYIVSTVCALILILTVTFIDLFYRLMRSILKKGG